MPIDENAKETDIKNILDTLTPPYEAPPRGGLFKVSKVSEEYEFFDSLPTEYSKKGKLPQAVVLTRLWGQAQDLRQLHPQDEAYVDHVFSECLEKSQQFTEDQLEKLKSQTRKNNKGSLLNFIYLSEKQRRETPLTSKKKDSEKLPGAITAAKIAEETAQEQARNQAPALTGSKATSSPEFYTSQAGTPSPVRGKPAPPTTPPPVTTLTAKSTREARKARQAANDLNLRVATQEAAKEAAKLAKSNALVAPSSPTVAPSTPTVETKTTQIEAPSTSNPDGTFIPWGARPASSSAKDEPKPKEEVLETPSTPISAPTLATPETQTFFSIDFSFITNLSYQFEALLKSLYPSVDPETIPSKINEQIKNPIKELIKTIQEKELAGIAESQSMIQAAFTMALNSIKKSYGKPVTTNIPHSEIGTPSSMPNDPKSSEQENLDILATLDEAVEALSPSSTAPAVSTPTPLAKQVELAKAQEVAQKAGLQKQQAATLAASSSPVTPPTSLERSISPEIKGPEFSDNEQPGAEASIPNTGSVFKLPLTREITALAQKAEQADKERLSGIETRNEGAAAANAELIKIIQGPGTHEKTINGILRNINSHQSSVNTIFSNQGHGLPLVLAARKYNEKLLKNEKTEANEDLITLLVYVNNIHEKNSPGNTAYTLSSGAISNLCTQKVEGEESLEDICTQIMGQNPPAEFRQAWGDIQAILEQHRKINLDQSDPWDERPLEEGRQRDALEVVPEQIPSNLETKTTQGGAVPELEILPPDQLASLNKEAGIGAQVPQAPQKDNAGEEIGRRTEVAKASATSSSSSSSAALTPPPELEVWRAPKPKMDSNQIDQFFDTNIQKMVDAGDGWPKKFKDEIVAYSNSPTSPVSSVTESEANSLLLNNQAEMFVRFDAKIAAHKSTVEKPSSTTTTTTSSTTATTTTPPFSGGSSSSSATLNPNIKGAIPLPSSSSTRIPVTPAVTSRPGVSVMTTEQLLKLFQENHLFILSKVYLQNDLAGKRQTWSLEDTNAVFNEFKKMAISHSQNPLNNVEALTDASIDNVLTPDHLTGIPKYIQQIGNTLIKNEMTALDDNLNEADFIDRQNAQLRLTEVKPISLYFNRLITLKPSAPELRVTPERIGAFRVAPQAQSHYNSDFMENLHKNIPSMIRELSQKNLFAEWANIQTNQIFLKWVDSLSRSMEAELRNLNVTDSTFTEALKKEIFNQGVAAIATAKKAKDQITRDKEHLRNKGVDVVALVKNYNEALPATVELYCREKGGKPFNELNEADRAAIQQIWIDDIKPTLRKDVTENDLKTFLKTYESLISIEDAIQSIELDNIARLATPQVQNFLNSNMALTQKARSELSLTTARIKAKVPGNKTVREQKNQLMTDLVLGLEQLQAGMLTNINQQAILSALRSNLYTPEELALPEVTRLFDFSEMPGNTDLNQLVIHSYSPSRIPSAPYLDLSALEQARKAPKELRTPEKTELNSRLATDTLIQHYNREIESIVRKQTKTANPFAPIGAANMQNAWIKEVQKTYRFYTEKDLKSFLSLYANQLKSIPELVDGLNADVAYPDFNPLDYDARSLVQKAKANAQDLKNKAFSGSSLWDKTAPQNKQKLTTLFDQFMGDVAKVLDADLGPETHQDYKKRIGETAWDQWHEKRIEPLINTLAAHIKRQKDVLPPNVKDSEIAFLIGKTLGAAMQLHNDNVPNLKMVGTQNSNQDREIETAFLTALRDPQNGAEEMAAIQMSLIGTLPGSEEQQAQRLNRILSQALEALELDSSELDVTITENLLAILRDKTADAETIQAAKNSLMDQMPGSDREKAKRLERNLSQALRLLEKEQIKAAAPPSDAESLDMRPKPVPGGKGPILPSGGSALGADKAKGETSPFENNPITLTPETSKALTELEKYQHYLNFDPKTNKKLELHTKSEFGRSDQEIKNKLAVKAIALLYKAPSVDHLKTMRTMITANKEATGSRLLHGLGKLAGYLENALKAMFNALPAKDQLQDYINVAKETKQGQGIHIPGATDQKTKLEVAHNTLAALNGKQKVTEAQLIKAIQDNQKATTRLPGTGHGQLDAILKNVLAETVGKDKVNAILSKEKLGEIVPKTPTGKKKS